jgi:hypothetical protein
VQQVGADPIELLESFWRNRVRYELANELLEGPATLPARTGIRESTAITKAANAADVEAALT